MNFVKLFIIKLFKPSKSFAASKFLLKQNKQLGFSLIGVMLAAAIGLIVATGISQLFASMATQLKQLQNQQDSATLASSIQQALQDPKICKASLTPKIASLKSTNPATIKLEKIKLATSTILYNLTDTNLLNNHGLTEASVKLTCVPIPPATDCATCLATIPTGADCINHWKLNFISQSLLKGVKLFNKPTFIASMKITFTDANTLSCNIEGGGSSLSA